MKYLVVSHNGGKPNVGELGPVPLGISITFKQFVAGYFNNGDTTKEITIDEIVIRTLENGERLIGLYHSIATKSEKKLLISGKEIYSDLFLIKKDKNDDYISLTESDIEIYKGHFYK